MRDTSEGKAYASSVTATTNPHAKPQRDEPEGELRISPLFNDAFLWIFGRQESKDVTRAFTNAILHRAGLEQIGEVTELRADTASPGGIEMRTARTDVVIVSEEGAIVDLEAQRERTNVNNKSLFYSSKLLCEHTLKGVPDDYSKLPQVIVIMLVEGWKMFGCDSFLSVGRIRWEHDGAFEDGSDRAIYVVAELDKVKKRYTANDEELATDEALAWLYLLADGYRDDHEMEQVMEQFDTIEEFAKRYKLAMGDPELKRAYERYFEERLEYNDRLHEGQRWAHEQGHKEGRKQGRKQGRKEGRKQGRKEGRKEGLDDVTERMRELGYDENAIATVMDGLVESNE